MAGVLERGRSLCALRPFRAPHHTISDAGLIGGGSIPRPGEVSLAHGGVLFLDELPEFRRNVLEVLRQPLEDGVVTLSRAAVSLTFPARFMLAAAMNPCPCGYFGDPLHACRCPDVDVERYRSRVSGPAARPHRHPPRGSRGALSRPGRRPTPRSRAPPFGSGSSSPACVQRERFRDRPGRPRQRPHDRARSAALLPARREPVERLLREAVGRLGLSARAYHRILKIGRTIADLAGADDLSTTHVSEAIQYRSLGPAKGCGVTLVRERGCDNHDVRRDNRGRARSGWRPRPMLDMRGSAVQRHNRSKARGRPWSNPPRAASVIGSRVRARSA